MRTLTTKNVGATKLRRSKTNIIHMARIIREALSTALAEELGAKITEALCNIDFSDLLDDLPGGKFLKRLIFRN